MSITSRRAVWSGFAMAIVYALHQDVWLWRSARPLVFGFLPAGLAYHAGYCVLVAMLLWWLTTYTWPAHLQQDDDR